MSLHSRRLQQDKCVWWYQVKTPLYFALRVFLFLTFTTHNTGWSKCTKLPTSDAFSTQGQLDFRERAPTPPRPDAPLVFALHGLGHHKKGFARLGRSLPRHWRVIWVDAPLIYRQGFAWYRFRCPEAVEDAQHSTRALIKLAHTLRKRYPHAPKPAIFGFSQGGVMTLNAVNTEPNLWSAGASFSGYWLPKTPPASLNERPGTPLLIIHGDTDSVVKLTRGQHSASLFSDAGYPVAWWGFSGGHRVTSGGLQAMTRHFEQTWLELSKTSSTTTPPSQLKELLE